MKRQIILILSIFIGLCSFAQISLTYKNNAFQPGETRAYISIPYTAPGEAGADRVWDFSKITLTGEKIAGTITDIPLKKAENNSDYFNIILNENGSEYYYKLSNDQLIQVGGVTKDYTLNYSDPLLKMIYPFSYENQFTDKFGGVALSPLGQKINFSGDITVTADAYGTLFLPGHAYTDALRVKAVSNEITINQCGSVETNVVRYSWYVSGNRFPVMTISLVESGESGKTPEITKSAMVWAGGNGDTPSGTVQPADVTINNEATVVIVYPNPFADNMNFHYILHKSVPVAITLTDITGKTVATLIKKQMQAEGLHSGSFNASDFTLNPGLYYIRFVFDNQVVIKKVIKL